MQEKKWGHSFKETVKNRVAMTLMEIMIVLTIIVGMATLVGPQLIKRFDESRVSTTKTQIRNLMNALDDYRRICGIYPTTEQGLKALVQAPTEGRLCKNYDPEGIMKRLPQDAWGNDFVYQSDGNHYEIKSLGANGVEGGTGTNADISSNDL